MDSIIEEINERISRIKKELPHDNTKKMMIKLIESLMKDEIPFSQLDIKTIFGILEFLGYDESNIMSTYVRLMSNIKKTRQYVIEEGGKDVDERN